MVWPGISARNSRPPELTGEEEGGPAVLTAAAAAALPLHWPHTTAVAAVTWSGTGPLNVSRTMVCL